MLQVIAGRFLQGLGGGLLSALAYILARKVFPSRQLPRVLALLTSVWSISALIGPLVGGLFATYASWRASFLAVAALAVTIALVAIRTLPADIGGGGIVRAVPGALIGLVTAAIAVMSFAAIVDTLWLKIVLVAMAITAMAVMVRLNARSPAPLLPTDAFAVHSPTGMGLWLVLLLSIAFSPVHIYVPVLLQKLHGFVPIAAGYAVAMAALAWTLAAVLTAPFSRASANVSIVAGPLAVAAGLTVLAMVLGGGPAHAILLALVLIGTGMGLTWSFAAQHIMARPKPDEGDLAASAVATVQQTGFALGAALSGIVANLAGFSIDAGPAGLAHTAIAVPAIFALAAVLAAIAGRRLTALAAANGPAA